MRPTDSVPASARRTAVLETRSERDREVHA